MKRKFTEKKIGSESDRGETGAYIQHNELGSETDIHETTEFTEKKWGSETD